MNRAASIRTLLKLFLANTIYTTTPQIVKCVSSSSTNVNSFSLIVGGRSNPGSTVCASLYRENYQIISHSFEESKNWKNRLLNRFFPEKIYLIGFSKIDFKIFLFLFLNLVCLVFHPINWSRRIIFDLRKTQILLFQNNKSSARLLWLFDTLIQKDVVRFRPWLNKMSLDFIRCRICLV